MESNYRVAYNKGWQDLKQKDPEEVSTYMQVTYLPEVQQFIVPLFNENYIVDIQHQTIARQADGKTPEMEAAILLLHYLSFFQYQAEPANKWVSLKEIPNGGILFYPAFRKTPIQSLINTFGNRPEFLLTCAARLGGQAAKFGDAAAVFQVFPKIPLCAVVWEGDEEVAANATILYDPSIAHFLHIESIIGVGWHLAQRLVRLAAKEQS